MKVHSSADEEILSFYETRKFIDVLKNVHRSILSWGNWI